MSTYPQWAAGQKITAALLVAAQPDFTIKTANESVTSSTTLQDDDHLSYAITATGTYTFELFLLVNTGDSAADLKTGFTFPTGTMNFFGSGPHEASLGAGTSGDGEFFARTSAVSGSSSIGWGISSGAPIGVRLWGALAATATGTLRLQWAQLVSSGTATTLLAGSWMSVQRRS